MEPRTEFGFPRTTCGCADCEVNCRYMPGFLIPADLERMIPEGADPFVWAEKNVLASPGALAMQGGKTFRIHTLVPATKKDGSCIHLAEDGRCLIHEVSPSWLIALGKVGVGGDQLPMKNEERISPFTSKGKCHRCRKAKTCTLVLDGFKGEIVDGNAMLCNECIGDIL